MPGLKHRAAIGQARPAPGSPSPHGVQGIASNLDDLLLRGEKWKSQVGDGLAEGTLVRKIVGASELNITLHDFNRDLLRSQLMQEEHEVSLDSLPFRFVKASSEGLRAPLALTYEPRLVTELRKIKGPHKAFRDKQTRAEFSKRRVREAEHFIRFVCPELHVKQPIESGRQAREAEERADEDRRKGIGDDPGPVHLTVKGDSASKPQTRLGDTALRIAEEASAPDRVMIALMAALIVESELGALSSDVLQSESFIAAGDDPEKQIYGFLTGKNWTATEGGAIGYFKRNPDAKAYEIAQAVQASGAGASSNGKANYGPVIAEATKWVEAFGGSSISSVEYVRYAFKQGKKESNWRVINRLAGEVRWRCFESAGVVYFITDRDLLDARVRFSLSDSTPGVIDTAFDLDLGKEADEMTISAYARAWAAPPGSVTSVTRHGPADGLWLVERIESPLAHRNSLCTIILKRPTEPKAEPTPSTRTVTIGGSGGTGNVPPAISTMIATIDAFDRAGTEYLWGGGHGSFASTSDRVDCSGFVSAVLHAAGYLDVPLTSGALASQFQSGEGEWLTIYADGQHVFGKIKYPDGNWRFFGTSHANPGGGPGWVPDSDGTSGSPSESGKAARHPKGL